MAERRDLAPRARGRNASWHPPRAVCRRPCRPRGAPLDRPQASKALAVLPLPAPARLPRVPGGGGWRAHGRHHCRRGRQTIGKAVTIAIATIKRERAVLAVARPRARQRPRPAPARGQSGEGMRPHTRGRAEFSTAKPSPWPRDQAIAFSLRPRCRISVSR